MTDRYQGLRDAIAAGAVLVALKRPESYEDVHPDILIDDAAIHPTFAPEHVGAELAALFKERDALREALSQYANPLNWEVDEYGIRRCWREPGSSTPDAYNGFELARAALADGETK